MFAIIKSAINYLLGFVLQGTIIKFILFTGLYLIVSELGSLVMSKIDKSGLNSISSLFSGLPSDVLFFMGVFRVEVGLPMIIAAFVVRFAIRRLPIIG
ncbi:DUF2523 family protein [Novosphingobium sp. P6W]|uniref:DUF2523 family protein n=1 Tax=Novosphingobium sp. P6W TaxID=1609758 RepID=UPI0005C2A8F6|nr:DUF2523 domain-containing protein [Novosphingobium sp. P6W]KIS30655.1 hypothetical protein TQ38_21285 [Novosphingobium sp. P6W]